MNSSKIDGFKTMNFSEYKVKSGYDRPRAVNGIDKIRSYIKTNNYTSDNFFKVNLLKDKNEEQFSKEDFKGLKSNITDLNDDEINSVFDVINENKLEKVNIKNLNLYFDEDYEKKKKVKTMNLSEDIKKEISDIFNLFDEDKKKELTKEQFVKAVRSVDPSASVNEINNIFEKSCKQNNKMDKETFKSEMENFIKKEFIISKDEKDYIIRIFKEYDTENEGFLTQNQIKFILKEKFNIEMTDEEIQKIVDDNNLNYNGKIDIEEFIEVLTNVFGQDENATLKNTILELKFKRKFNPNTYISVYKDLPSYFIPSFIGHQQKLLKLLPSSILLPKKDKSGINYIDIFSEYFGYSKEKKKNKSNVEKKVFLGDKIFRSIDSNINCKIEILSATGVPAPSPNLREIAQNKVKVVKRSLKIALFDNENKIFVGNAVTLDAKEEKKNQISKWEFDSDKKSFNNHIIVRLNDVITSNFILVFEFVLTIQRRNITSDTTVGWTSCDLRQLGRKQKVIMNIHGGTPTSIEEIRTEDITQPSGFAAIFSKNENSELIIGNKPFKDMNGDDKNIVNYLPETCIIHRASLQLIGTYRKVIANYILNHQDFGKKAINLDNLYIMHCFCKIADCPDAFRLMTELWNETALVSATSAQKEDDEYVEKIFEEYTNKIYSAISTKDFMYNELDPTHVPIENLELMTTRNKLINGVIRSNLGDKYNKNKYKSLEDNDVDYEPFTLDEFKNEKFTIIDKIDEFHESLGY